MGNVMPEFGDLVFSIIIGYLGALELMYVVRHLYHWTCHHAAEENSGENLQDLQQNLQKQLGKAEEQESEAGGRKVMRDGVQYEDGFRVDGKSDKDNRRQELEKELAKQKRIEEETRKQLQKAEEELLRQQREAAAERERELAEEAVQSEKLLKAERELEDKQKQKEKAEEAAQSEKLLKAERELEEKEKAEEAAQHNRILEAEREQENKQKLIEEAAQNNRILEAERQREAEQQQKELLEAEIETQENEKRLLLAEKHMELQQKALEEEEDRKATELVMQLLEAEREREELEQQRLQHERELKQKLIEENARKFMEAEEEMVQLQQQIQLAAAEEPVNEEVCVKKQFQSHYQAEAPVIPTIKTQYTQGSKGLLFPGISDDTSSADPNSSERSSFSHQNSEDMLSERQEPEGEDHTDSPQFTEEYLRSLDGIKGKALTREDGSGRRRAFKKRRSSGSSNSSRDSRASRDEELKMFTSLEEEENARSKDDEDYVPIKYSSEPSLKVKAPRRHKRSPAKDAKDDDSLRSSLEMLGEENVDPWGEVVPETYKNTEFWQREKAMSIDEEELELPKTAKHQTPDIEVSNMPKTSTFEAASATQNEKAIQKLKTPSEENETKPVQENVQWETQVNLQSSSRTEHSASPALRRSPRIDEMDHYEERWSASNSPQPVVAAAATTSKQTPQIKVDNAPWRDKYGLMVEGLSDFYDFQASVNPSRSRSTSRNASPCITPPSSKNVSFDKGAQQAAEVDVYDDTGNLNENEFSQQNICQFIESLTQNSDSFSCNDIKLQLVADDHSRESAQISGLNCQELVQPAHSRSRSRTPAAINIQQNDETTAASKGAIPKVFAPVILIQSDETLDAADSEECSRENMSKLVETLRIQQSRSRSKSPLPTASNLQQSLDKRRQKLIQKNDDIFEQLQSKPKETPQVQVEYVYIVEEEQNLTIIHPKGRSRSRTPSRSPSKADKVYEVPSISIESTDKEEHTPREPFFSEDMSKLVESLRVQRSQSRSKSPLPTAGNLAKGLEKRRQKLIQKNYELIEKLLSNDSANVEIRVIYEQENNEETLTGSKSPSKAAQGFYVPSITIESTASEESLRLQRSGSRSKSPLPTSKAEQDFAIESTASEKSEEQEDMSKLVESLRVQRSRSRSKSPLPTAHNLAKGLEKRRQKLIQKNDELIEKLFSDTDNAAAGNVEVQYVYEYEQEADDNTRMRSSRSRTPSKSPPKSVSSIAIECEDSPQSTEYDSKSDMSQLVQSLRIQRSRSRSKSPLPTVSNLKQGLEKRRQKLIHRNDELIEQLQKSTEEAPQIEVQYVIQYEDGTEIQANTLQLGRSRTPTRSMSPKKVDMYSDISDFNLEGSHKNSEELESGLIEKQHEMDLEALHQLKTAEEEVELRTMSPQQRQHSYGHTKSQDARDVELLKNEHITGSFKRSTYVGESLEMGSEFEPLRKQLADFDRSQSPSPSCSRIETEMARQLAKQNQDIQNQVLSALTADSTREKENHDLKLQLELQCMRQETAEFNRSASRSRSPLDEEESKAILAIEAEAARRAEEDKLIDELEYLRDETAEFKRSASKSRSPLDDEEYKILMEIEAKALRRAAEDEFYEEELEDNEDYEKLSNGEMSEEYDEETRESDPPNGSHDFKMYLESECLLDNDNNPSTSSKPHSPFESQDKVEVEAANFQNFTRHLNVNFLESERRASDSTVFKKTDNIKQLDDMMKHHHDMEPDEYHHFRRYSLFQELPMEDYPSDDEVFSNKGSKHWEYEDFYSEDYDEQEIEYERNMGQDNDNINQDEEEENVSVASYDGSEDERRTVVEVEDEIDTDICDFSERGPTDESHHEQSECEEADRAVDHYANHQAIDWQTDVAPQSASVVAYDSDSFAIEQIYGDAIRNRKQSGIMRDYDSILEDMQHSYADHNVESEEIERYALWSKTRALEKSKSNEPSTEAPYSLLDAEKRSQEMRYLGDADSSARQSARLRSRYGFVPVLQSTVCNEEVDLNYKPKREYNWRKNFKVEEEQQELTEINGDQNGEYTNGAGYFPEDRKFSLGGESITLYSRSPDREILESVTEETHQHDGEPHDIIMAVEEKDDKPKKKKTKKKTRKDTKISAEELCRDEDDSESQIYARRSSSLQMETDSPKRKSRSRRSSRSSLNSEDPNGLFSPRSSVGQAEPLADLEPEYVDTSLKKKTKKRSKKPKESFGWETPQIKEESNTHALDVVPLDIVQPVSRSLSPESSSSNLLSTLSPEAGSVCITPASSKEPSVSRKPSTSNGIDSFDILKDGNFYPLF